MNTPSSTYRIQFHKDFTFSDFLTIIDYLHRLGISTIYASPILKSVRGSIHGYDVTDPHVIDPEIGTKEELQTIAIKLKERGMTWLQDIVPNHMAFDPSNERLMDVLERGQDSTFYHYFDIQWNHPAPELNGKLMVPFLGEDLKTCVKNKEVKLAFTKYGFEISYFKARYPVSSIAYENLFSIFRSASAKKLRQEWGEFMNGRAYESHFTTWRKLKAKWINAIPASERNTIQDIVDRVNADEEKLLNLLSNQHYVFTHWKQTEKQINYRRFFTINQLICLRMEDENVFSEYHSFLHSLYKSNLIQGFRIDHIDGLRDPAQYIRRLRNLFGDACYIIAEKILEAREVLPRDWLLQGTSGYEFLAQINQLFTDKKGARHLLDFYRTLVPSLPPYKQLVTQNKKMMLEGYMEGEWNNLVDYFIELGLQGDLTRPGLKQALGSIMISLPIYRIYPEQIPLEGNDLSILNETFNIISQSQSPVEKEQEYIYTLFTAPDDKIPKANILLFLQRLMQFTGPLMAKGVEDTTFYIYNPLISHDEVGDSPSTLGMTINEFHRRMSTRRESSPNSLNATATHDTKRGEDVRIRLNVLSEIPDKWEDHVRRWRAANTTKQRPDINDEYFIYQSIVGGFPEDLQATEAWIKRLKEYLVKVVREAKVKSTWEFPNENYETICTDFVEHIFAGENNFLPDILPFVENVIDIAHYNALGQLLIKITAPGIPDVYQGCELWDLSYVDPDNRRPVDFETRKKYLSDLFQKENEGCESLLSFVKEHRRAGMEKLYVAWRALNFRRSHDDIFNLGEYLPLQFSRGDSLACVFARHVNEEWVLVIIPLGLARTGIQNPKEGWTSESIILGPNLPSHWINIFTGKEIDAPGELSLIEALGQFPIALLTNKKA